MFSYAALKPSSVSAGVKQQKEKKMYVMKSNFNNLCLGMKGIRDSSTCDT